MAVFGQIGAFKESTENFGDYADRFDSFLVANKITEEMKCSIFLATVGADSFRLLKNLCSPESPASKSYDELVCLLKTHFKPEPIVIAERHKFWSAVQGADESMSSFVVKLKSLASTCSFGAFLPQALRDRLVSGLNPRMRNTQCRLLTIRDLTFEVARDHCIADELAAQSRLNLTPQTVEESHRIHTKSKNPGVSYSKPKSLFCRCCGGQGHGKDTCKLKDASCFQCGRRGHVKKICPDSAKRRHSRHRGYDGKHQQKMVYDDRCVEEVTVDHEEDHDHLYKITEDKVYCRIKPLEDVDDENCVDVISPTTIQLNPPKNSKASERGRLESMQCMFKRVFADDVQQVEIYQQSALPLVEDLVSGKNGLIFMYGITGSGKTYTMNGTASDSGILPRCLDVLFNSVGHVQAPKFVFKPDNYNRYYLQTEEEAKSERDRRAKESAIITPRTPRSKRPWPVKQYERRDDFDAFDIARIPDQTRLEVDEDNLYSVFITYVEIYNNFIYDLLDESPVDPICPKAPISKMLREDFDRNMYVYGATEVEVKSMDEAYEAFWRGQRRRRVAHTQLNAESSRSHSVFQIRLVQAPLDSSGTRLIQDKKQIAVSNLSLCDLAGSERSNRTNNEGDRLREAGNINASLMTLRNCIEVLRENQKAAEMEASLKIVPYRDTKLTNLFKTFFEGEGKVRMIVCLNPKADDFDESLHVMKFAEATQEVKIAKSEGVRFDLGLTPGRGKALRALKDNRKDSNEDLASVSSGSSSPEIVIFEEFEPFPPLEITSCQDNSTLPRLIAYLENRMRKRTTLLLEFSQRHEGLRQMLASFEHDRVDLVKALETKKSQLSSKEREVSNLEKRIRTLTSKNDHLQKAASEFASEKKTMHEEIEKKQRQIERERHDKLRLKQDVKDLVSNEKNKWEKVCQKRVRDKELEMEDQILMKSEKLRQLREIVTGYETPNTVAIDIPIDEAPPSNFQPTTPRRGSNKENATAITPRFQRVATTMSAKTGPPVAAKPPRKLITKSATHMRGRSRSPAPIGSRKDRNQPLRSRHRRSRSSDYWIEHKPKDTLETDTIMQPQVRKKKTVNNPTVKDLKGVKYLLQHQEEDTDGEIETQLIKGEIMKTRSGGHSVQFTDVELLKKKPTPPSKLSSSGKNEENTPLSTRGRKRSSEEMAQEAGDSEDSWTSVETRCAIAIEGKPGTQPAVCHSAKRMK